jgi:hypothetical protein
MLFIIKLLDFLSKLSFLNVSVYYWLIRINCNFSWLIKLLITKKIFLKNQYVKIANFIIINFNYKKIKKIILTAAFLFLVVFSFAQDKKEAVQVFSKGDLLVPAEVKFVFRSWGGNSTSIICPSFVYFTSDNVSVSARYKNEKSGYLIGKVFGIGTAYHINAGKQFSI